MNTEPIQRTIVMVEMLRENNNKIHHPVVQPLRSDWHVYFLLFAPRWSLLDKSIHGIVLGGTMKK